MDNASPAFGRRGTCAKSRRGIRRLPAAGIGGDRQGIGTLTRAATMRVRSKDESRGARSIAGRCPPRIVRSVTDRQSA
ncbi:hypothetical protein C7S16_6105 [Burkholderia thailandensis]|uniref:Uncharacterized protein n=1 Tax=Burkholderia thailandensis TaxID=57975 RepID=A0AAW9CKX7_BURTH|nr:hypothetical protein [Burkholderia thailandensis]